METTVEELDIQALAAKRRKEKEEKEKNKGQNFSYDREQIEWLSMEDGVMKAFRPLGKPFEMRTESWHPKLVYHSEMVTDDGKGYIKINWPQKTMTLKNGFIFETGELDDSWILMRAYKDLNKRTWENYPAGTVVDGKNGKWNYHHADTHVFKRIEANRKENDKYPPRFYPGKRVLLPLIDRMDSWCADNNHTKLMTSKSVFWKKDEKTGLDIVFTDFGVPELVYSKLLEQVSRTRKDWSTMDVIIQKDSANKTYNFFDADDRKYFTGAHAALKELASEAPLTEAEMAYEHYDLDKIARPCSYTKLLNRVPNFFKEVDVVCGTSYYDLLKHEAEKEKAAWEAEKGGKSFPVPEKPAAPAPVQESAPARRPSAAKTAGSLEDQAKKAFAAWDKIPDGAQKAILDSVISITADGVPVFKSAQELGCGIFPCSDEKCTFSDGKTPTQWPESVSHCGVCGVKYA